MSAEPPRPLRAKPATCPVCGGSPVYYAAPWFLNCGTCRGAGVVQATLGTRPMLLVDEDDEPDWGGEVNEIGIFEGP